MYMENTTKKLIAYYRVSSKRQKDEGVSIEAQQKLIRDYCTRKGYEIVKEFSIDESAKAKGRKIFTEMMDLVRISKDVSGIVCEKQDRLLRGESRDKLAIEDLINDGNKEIHLVKEGTILNKDSKSSEKLYFDMQCAMARFFLNNLSDEVKKGYGILVDDGFYPHIPPLGYYSKLEDHRAIEDPSVSKYVRRAFELCATGEHSEKKIAQILYDEGLRSRKGKRVNKSTIASMLHNHFYYGYYSWADGGLKPGLQDKIIDKELFDKVQDVLSPHKKKGYKHDFSYVGLMRCGECGNGITAELQKGHVYYHCTKPKGAEFCSQKYTREEVVTEQLAQVIKAVTLSLKKIKIIKDIMSVSLADETEYLQESLNTLNGNYTDLQDQSTKLLDLYLKGRIKDEVYNSKSAEINQQTEQVNSEIAKHKGADRAYKQEIEGFLTFCNQAPKLFASSRPELQRELLRFVVSNLILKDKKVDFSLKLPFSILAKYAESENWQGQRESNPQSRFWRPLVYR